MINKSSLLQMKDNIMLINTSRGALINTTDIIEAKMVKLVIGIDVYEQEEKLFLKICLKILFKTMIYND
jgi:D-lactate dehydrogenase